MQTKLIPLYQETEQGKRAEEILRTCVHCGFCNATCPTYQVLGDELDGPRGRIYQIKHLLEGGEFSEQTQVHLERCLTCRACETTCPSGVQYHELLEIGKQALDEVLPNKLHVKRKLVHAWLIRPKLFALSLKLGRQFRALMPEQLKSKVPPKDRVELKLNEQELSENTEGANASRGTILMFGACIQKAVTPQVGIATRIVFQALGYRVHEIGDGQCCGALSQHTGEPMLAKTLAMRNIDAWLQAIDQEKAVAIAANASGCGVFIKDYPELFASDDPYREKAMKLAEMCKDPIELIDSESIHVLRDRIAESANHPDVIAFHPPCTLQHGQKLAGAVERMFDQMGIELMLPHDAHLCCGSAGTYSILQPELSNKLRDAKVAHIQALEPDLILSANIGCQSHLAAKTARPVVHWLQWLAQMLTNSTKL